MQEKSDTNSTGSRESTVCSLEGREDSAFESYFYLCMAHTLWYQWPGKDERERMNRMEY